MTSKNKTWKNIIIACVVFVVLSISNCILVSADTHGEADFASLALFCNYQKEDIYGQNNAFYVLNGGCFVEPASLYVDMKSSNPLSRVPYKYGYDFDGWYYDSTLNIKAEVIDISKNQDYILFAKWIPVVDNYYNVMNYEYAMENEEDAVLLKNLDFGFVNQVDIPGMEEEEDSDNIIDSIFKTHSQCPQGLCITDEFIMVTTYSFEDDCLGELVVFDRETGKKMVTLGLDPNSHLGGITFDGENIWLCNSNDKTIERISFDFIQLMAYANTGKMVDATSVVDSYKVSNSPSCITFYDGRIWIATHTLFFNSSMIAYHYDSDHNKLETLNKYTIPSQVQGVAFHEDGRVLFSTSYGRDVSSYIKIYNSLIDVSSSPNKPLVVVEMPPGSEEIDLIGNEAYIIFESASEKYRKGTDGKGTSLSPIDKILTVDLDSIP